MQLEYTSGTQRCAQPLSPRSPNRKKACPLSLGSLRSLGFSIMPVDICMASYWLPSDTRVLPVVLCLPLEMRLPFTRVKISLELERHDLGLVEVIRVRGSYTCTRGLRSGKPEVPSKTAVNKKSTPLALADLPFQKLQPLIL